MPELPTGHLGTKKSTLPEDANGQVWLFTLHRHHSIKAGPHYDIRLGDPKTGIGYSWASRYFPHESGRVYLATQQPDHELEYFKYKGLLPQRLNEVYDLSKYDLNDPEVVKKLINQIKNDLANASHGDRYGGGLVQIADTGTATILNSSPDKITFQINGSKINGVYSLIRTDGDKFLLLKKKDKFSELNIQPYRERTKEIPVAKAHEYITDRNKIFLRKDDGVQLVYILHAKKPVVAVTPNPAVDGKYINRTQHIGLANVIVPDHLDDTIAHGEVILVDSKGVARPLNEVVGFLNMKLPQALEFLRDNGYKVYRTIFDVDRFAGKNLRLEPFGTRLKLAKIVARGINNDVPEYAILPSEKLKLMDDIRSGKNPKSKEGIVIQDLANLSDPLKAKFKKEYDVYITGIIPGKNSLENIGAGAVTYSLTPGGPTVGKVGAGFSLSERIDMLKHPDKYIGRAIKVKSIRQTDSGALFQPAFISFHPEKGKSIWEAQ
ncbi:MAG: hypothetical protein ACP5JE_04615 [Thermoplasmata archaeon]